eukprot:6201828-Pleurochrysis_carterae.AAC.1
MAVIQAKRCSRTGHLGHSKAVLPNLGLMARSHKMKRFKMYGGRPAAPKFFRAGRCDRTTQAVSVTREQLIRRIYVYLQSRSIVPFVAAWGEWRRDGLNCI